MEKDLYQFAYDEKEDYVDIYIENYNSNIKTFWDDDFLELYLTKNSGLKWDDPNVDYTQILNNSLSNRIYLENLINDKNKKSYQNQKPNSIYLGRFNLIENPNFSSNFYEIRKIITNNQYVDEYLDPNEANHYYSKLNFDLTNDYGIYSKVKTTKPFTLPSTIISQKGESSLKKMILL